MYLYQRILRVQTRSGDYKETITIAVYLKILFLLGLIHGGRQQHTVYYITSFLSNAKLLTSVIDLEFHCFLCECKTTPKVETRHPEVGDRIPPPFC